MAITQGFPVAFKSELLSGTHNLASGGHTIKVALYTSSATLDSTTTAYSATNEVSGTGYSAGGATIATQAIASSGSTAYVDFSDVTWSTSTITARGALVYNSSSSNKAILIVDFGSDKVSAGSDFVLTWPSPDASNAIIRIT